MYLEQSSCKWLATNGAIRIVVFTIKSTSQPKLTKEGPSGEEKETVIKTNVVMDAEAMSGLRDPSIGISWLLADSEEGSVSVGSRHLHRSTGQEDTKVVRQGQMDNYYERFCETVAMGLPGRVIDLDVAGLEHEADDEKEERARYETEIESEVNGYEETALG